MSEFLPKGVVALVPEATINALFAGSGDLESFVTKAMAIYETMAKTMINLKKHKRSSEDGRVSAKRKQSFDIDWNDWNAILRSKFEQHYFSASCEGAACTNYVSRLNVFVAATDEYVPGMDGVKDCVRLLCSDCERTNTFAGKRKGPSIEYVKVFLSLYGLVTHAPCSICNSQKDVVYVDGGSELCHVKSQSSGGSRETTNLVIGSRACNSAQGDMDLEPYQLSRSYSVKNVWVRAFDSTELPALVRILRLSKSKVDIDDLLEIAVRKFSTDRKLAQFRFKK